MVKYDIIPPKNENDKHVGLLISLFLVVSKQDDEYQQEPTFKKGWEFLNGMASVVAFDKKLLNSGITLTNNLDVKLRHKGMLKHNELTDPYISNGVYWFYVDTDNNGDPPNNIRKIFEPLLLDIVDEKITINYLRDMDKNNTPIEYGQETLFETNKIIVQVMDIYNES